MVSFIGIKDVYGLDDFGMSGQTFKVLAIKKDKIYIANEDGYVIDDNGCWHRVGTKSFNDNFNEVTQKQSV